MEKIQYNQSVINNAETIYKKYESEVQQLVDTYEDKSSLYLDAMGVPFQDKDGNNFSYSSNFLFCYMLLKKLKEADYNINDYVEEDPLFYIVGYQSKGALVAYLMHYKEEFGLEKEKELEFIANINNIHYMKKLNESIKNIISNTTGFKRVEGSEGVSLSEILLTEMTAEEKYLVLINSIIASETSIENEKEEVYNDLYENLGVFLNTIFNYSIKEDEKFFSYYITFLSESVESIPVIYELKRDFPEMWEQMTELVEEELEEGN